MSDKSRCGKPTKKGSPCTRPRMKGEKTCLAHLPRKQKEARGFGGPQPGSGRPKLPTTSQLLRKVVEENVVAILSPHFRVLGYDVEVKPDEAEGQRIVLVPLKAGGAKLHGESREGVVKMSDHEDLGAQIAASEKLLDRALGRPKQSTELTGAAGGPLEIVPVTREKARQVGGILAGVGAGGG